MQGDSGGVEALGGEAAHVEGGVSKYIEDSLLKYIEVYQSILYPYTAERRDVLGNTSPEAREISQGRGFCTPRPERLAEGNLSY